MSIKPKHNKYRKIGVLIIEPTGFIGSNLILNLLLDNSYQLFCLVPPPGNPKEMLFKAVINSAKSAGLSRIISKKMQNLTVIGMNSSSKLVNFLKSEVQSFKNLDISYIWYCADSFKIKDKHNIDIIKLAKLLKATWINYITIPHVSGILSPSLVHKNCNSSKITNSYKEGDQQFKDILQSANEHGLFQLRIFRSSIVIGNTKTYDSTFHYGFYEFLSLIERFIKWTKDRIPDYFDNNPVCLYREDGTTLNLVPIDILVNMAISISKENISSPQIYNLTNPFPVSIDSIIPAMKNAFPDIEFKITNNIEDLSPLDKILYNRLQFYTSYMASFMTSSTLFVS